jgi:ABC-type bacteriocin/lantibiotic exporter with double-glycine peptidase domain
MTLGRLLSCNMLTLVALGPVTRAAADVLRLPLVAAHADRLDDILTATPEGGATITLVDEVPHIRADAMEFTYPAARMPAIAGIDIDIAPGEFVAIVGASGSGKSTLAMVLGGLFPPSTGALHYGEADAFDLDPAALRAHFGVVCQNATLFAGTIRDIITLAAGGDASHADVVRAARIAQIHNDIAALPMGYETVIGDGGTGLSGGQIQRLALARAVLARPGVLVLDEATSALDPTTEARVIRRLRALGCTLIVVTHRPDVAAQADRVLVMHNGAMVA